MQIKALQTQVAIEELEDTVKRSNKNESEIRKELEIYKQSDGRPDNSKFKFNETNKHIIESKENEIIKLKQRNSELQNSLDLRDREVIALRSQVESLRDEIENQRQVEDNIVETREEPIEKLREKNKQIQTLLDELRDVESINLEFANQIKKLKIELNSATNELHLNGNQMEMMSKQINELKQLNDDFVEEKQFFIEEIDKLRITLSKYESEDNNIIDRYEQSIKDLQQLIQTKDEKIVKLKSSGLVSDDNTKDRIKRLNKDLEEKTKQIDLLKLQLNEAVVDMENQTEIIKKLYQHHKDDEEVSKLNQTIASLTQQFKSIEEEVLTKDSELLNLRKKINNYEKGEYGLKEALKEVSDLKKHLENRNQRIEEMVDEINHLKLELNDAEDIIDDLQEDNKVVMRDKTKKNRGNVDFKQTKSSKKERIKTLELEQQLLKLEDEKIELTEKLRQNVNQSTADLQLDNKEINDLKEKLKSIESENLELQIGMKEILIGIRETDSKSDVIIECPTLERICRLMESRAINGDLTNVIALKAELDLVRGHNDQLRTDIRQIRNDYLNVITLYTQYLLDIDVMDSEEQQINNTNEDKSVLLKESDSQKYGNNVQQIVDNNQQLTYISKETQTHHTSDDTFVTTIKSQQVIKSCDIFTQTEYSLNNEMKLNDEMNEIKDNQIERQVMSNKLCDNCSQLKKVITFLKDCLQKLEQYIKTSESKFNQRLQLLQQENQNLMDICKNVLESVINCLQARLEHKEESIRQYRNMLSEAKQNFENEMIGLIESQREGQQQSGINLVQMIDNEELQSALKSCVNELDLCKSQLNAKIHQLEEELEIKNQKLMSYHTENEELRHKRTNPNVQLKQLVEELREEYDRAMRAASAVKRPQNETERRDKKVDNELFQELADLRTTIETQKQNIRHLEVSKWDSDKNIKELKEKLKNKIKAKDIEMGELKEKLDKMKDLFNKTDNEKQLLQNKINQREKVSKNSQNKWTQTSGANNELDFNKFKQEIKTLKSEFKDKENEVNNLRKELQLNRDIECELKTLLEESVKREKLSTIHEESPQYDQQYEQLLQENARMKVELRMTEYELKRRSQQSNN
ncbi:centrosomal protein of 290 kDa-like [Oppia nitens]|uniref:centrosomal protein of 290 kDa-like n=1 Tax=Oppia nitens TaxID=1686743 RepID=UPI0023DB492B|nr:centrosomal protein of 290 kDa-like [Oppia nitens]